MRQEIIKLGNEEFVKYILTSTEMAYVHAQKGGGIYNFVPRNANLDPKSVLNEYEIAFSMHSRTRSSSVEGLEARLKELLENFRIRNESPILFRP